MRRVSMFAFGLTILAFSGTFASAQSSEAERQRAMVGIIMDDPEALELLKNEGVDFAALAIDGNSLLAYAAAQGSLLAVRFMVLNGADIDAIDPDGFTPIMRALEAGYLEVAKDLAISGASLEGITDDGHSVRSLADRMGLEDFGPEYSDEPVFELTKVEATLIALSAAEAGDITAYDFAIANGAGKDIRASNGWTPLMLAALGGQAEMLKHIVDLRHDPSFKSSAPYSVDGITAIHASLVGIEGKDSSLVYEMLNILKNTPPFTKSFSDPTFRSIVDRSSFAPTDIARLGQLFPYPPLPRLEYALPVGRPETEDGWREVQGILAAEGLYKGEIDGRPGPQTYRALLAYTEPLLEVIVSRSILAINRAMYSPSHAKNIGQNYAFLMNGDETNLTITAGEFSRSSGLPVGYKFMFIGNTKADVEYPGAYFMVYHDQNIETWLGFTDYTSEQRGEKYFATFPLFDKDFNIYPDTDGLRLCFGVTSSSTCAEAPIVRAYDEIPKIYVLYSQLVDRVNAERKEVEAARRAEISANEKRKIAEIAKEKEEIRLKQISLKLEGVNDTKLTKLEFEDLFLGKLLYYADFSRIEYLPNGKFNFWYSTGGKIPDDATYFVQPNGTLCGAVQGIEFPCYHWVHNENRVLMVSKDRRIALKKDYDYYLKNSNSQLESK